MQADPALERETLSLQTGRGLQAFVLVALITAAVFGIYASTSWSMVEIWRRSETFVHGFFVLPAFLYLVWQRREALAVLPIRPYWPGVVFIAGAGFLWLLAQVAGTLAPAQFAMTAMVPLALLTLLGARWLRTLLFPCLFLFFAVPFGEVFVPTLIDWTADFTITALRLSGVPVYREGTYFVLPTGNWSVVEGCSGIRYLIASTVVGSLYAWLMYRSAVRRALFVLASVLVPIVANWLRAYGIVMLGHLSDNRIATGVDHIIYGWLFFGIVILVLFAIGARWREVPAAADETSLPAAASGTVANSQPWRIGAPAFIVTTIVLAIWPFANIALTSLEGEKSSTPLQLAPVEGWQRDSAFSVWQANVVGPTDRLVTYVAKDGRRVGVQLAAYRNQRQGAELVASGNRLVNPDGKSDWHVNAQRHGRWRDDRGAIEYTEAFVYADRPLAVRHWYQLRDRTTTSDVVAKLMLAVDRLLGRDDASAWVIVFTPAEGGIDEGRAVLDSFMRDMTPAIGSALNDWSK